MVKLMMKICGYVRIVKMFCADFVQRSVKDVMVRMHKLQKCFDEMCRGGNWGIY